YKAPPFGRPAPPLFVRAAPLASFLRPRSVLAALWSPCRRPTPNPPARSRPAPSPPAGPRRSPRTRAGARASPRGARPSGGRPASCASCARSSSTRAAPPLASGEATRPLFVPLLVSRPVRQFVLDSCLSSSRLAQFVLARPMLLNLARFTRRLE
uniref:Uncharacterized protein n=1 Tax=Aegilops tauschii subsp. strangulata TaxID=200361 RepID=A0A453HBK6_AEGTS